MYNEESNVDEFFRRLAVMADDELRGVVVVDDGSTDQTVTRIERLLESYPVPVRVVRLSRNFGHQPAVIAGCDHACQFAELLGAEWIGIIDGDLQDRPEDFSVLLDHAEGQDVVYAVRAQRHDGWVMRHFAPVFYGMLSGSSSFPIPRNSGTFSIIRIPVCKLIVQSADSEPYFPGLRAWVGFRQKGLPFDRQPRASGTSKVALRGLVRLSLRALILHSDMPMRLILGITALLFAVLVVLAALVTGLRLGGVHLPTGFTTIVLLQIFSLGLCAGFFVVIAFMVQRVKTNTSHQKPWIAMEVTQSSPQTCRDNQCQ
jgi:dolichol-phosphate mannosyltransferase